MHNTCVEECPALGVILVSCCLRLTLQTAHCFKPQIMMSSRELGGGVKCSATGHPRDRFRTLRRCSLKRSRSCLSFSEAIHPRKKDGGGTFYHANLTQPKRHKESQLLTILFLVPVPRPLISLG